jgi:hypothetical protein
MRTTSRSPPRHISPGRILSEAVKAHAIGQGEPLAPAKKGL